MKFVHSLRTIKQKYRQTKLINSLRFGNNENDYFLISFPKSGNTWVRFLLANLMKEGEEIITLKNIGEYIPDIYIPFQREYLSKNESLFNSLPVKIIKTHDPYMKVYNDKQIIYIVRDGRDTLNSYYYYINSRKKEKVTIKDLLEGLKGNEYGMWHNHILGWEKANCKKKLIIKYEELLSRPFFEVRKILDFVKLQVQEEKIEQALELASFDKLKTIEKEFGGINKIDSSNDKKTPFFRKGQIGDWRNNFTKEDEEEFWKIYGEAMHVFGYKK